MGFIIFSHFMEVTAQIMPLDRPISLFTQQLLQYEGVPQEVNAMGTFV